MSGIVWLASFPKSGNTWFRVFLQNLLAAKESPADINRLGLPIVSARKRFEHAVGLEASDLKPDEIARLRPQATEIMARTAKEPLVLKIHDAYRPADGDPPIVSATATACTVYLVRNPLDVAISWAHHRGQSLDRAIDDLCNPRFQLGGSVKRISQQLPQIIRDWSSHARSWMAAPVRMHVVRYEDLLTHPVDTFEAAVRFIGWPFDRPQIERAERFSRFDVISAQERETPFREKSPRTNRFFRQGRSGMWQTLLTPAQVDRVVEAHADVMHRFGYLTDDQEPL
jgi:hypothetical protein